jgi:agmatinase
MRNFAGIDDEFASFEHANILLQNIPYDGTSTWGKGADKGFDAFLEAAENMEVYDIETDSEVYREGVHILPAIRENASPEAMCKAVYENCINLLKTEKFLSFFGGEHSVSIGLIDAFAEKFENLSVLQLDAHADLRATYLGSACNHACAVYKASKNLNLVQVGIRSMDISEKIHLKPSHCFFAENMHNNTEWMQASIDLLGDNVYLTIDLDVLDPSIMPETGTPEPGGMDWNTTIRYLREVFRQKNVVGFDIVEFAPVLGLKAPAFLVAKLYYKLLSYKFYKND